MPADLAGLRDQLELGQFLQQGPGQCGALADQDQRLEICQIFRPGGGGKYLDLMAVEQLEAVEVTDAVLIVIEYGDLHGSLLLEGNII